MPPTWPWQKTHPKWEHPPTTIHPSTRTFDIDKVGGCFSVRCEQRGVCKYFWLLIRDWLKDDPDGQQTVARALEHAGEFFPSRDIQRQAFISPARNSLFQSVFRLLASGTQPKPLLSLKPTSCWRRTPLLSGSTKCSSLLGDLAACARVRRKVFSVYLVDIGASVSPKIQKKTSPPYIIFFGEVS